MDWNDDGLLDIIVGDRNGYVNYFRRTSNDAITLTTMPDITCGGVTIDCGYNSSPAITDWDEDGDLDMLLGTQDGYVRLYLNDGGDSQPVFNSYTNIMSGGSNIYHYRNCPRVYDLDQDGRKDLICGANDYYVYYYQNTGTNSSPSFSGWERIAYKYSGMRLWIDDWNEDGLPDMLTSDYNGYVWMWIQENTAVGDEQAPILPRALAASRNPFDASVVISASGFGPGSIRVFDLSGRAVVNEPFDGSFAWNGAGAANGTYLVRVEDADGASTLRLVKL
ncbi:T9SS type A sorting domain-containing protein [Candidatus Fermentibacterales bacterium]|nr:T9SS type A sorting domain-containing protein [Candidatus Fermentibacterales bacterium]